MSEIKLSVPDVRELMKGKKTVVCIIAWSVIDYMAGIGQMDPATAEMSKRVVETLGGVSLMAKFNRMGGETPKATS